MGRGEEGEDADGPLRWGSRDGNNLAAGDSLATRLSFDVVIRFPESIATPG